MSLHQVVAQYIETRRMAQAGAMPAAAVAHARQQVMLAAERSRSKL